MTGFVSSPVDALELFDGVPGSVGYAVIGR
jgi:hypothetical protein